MMLNTDGVKRFFFRFTVVLLVVGILFFTVTGTWELLALAVVAGIQNMVFTWVSRSRNSGDPYYHFPIAILSNSIWAICNYGLLFPKMIKVFVEGEDIMLGVVVLVIYTIATAVGSTIMMMHLLKVEKGKQQVGAR